MNSSNADYCSCGRPKSKTARSCWYCTSANPKHPNAHQYDTCPGCGGPKRKHASLCRKCGSTHQPGEEIIQKRRWYGEEPDYSGVDPVYAAVTSGLICGEGSIILRNTTPSVQVGLHTKDHACLERLLETYGGYICTNGGGRNFSTWSVNGMGSVRCFLTLILPYARLLNAIKVRDMEIMLEYIEWRISIGRCSGRGKVLPAEHRQKIEEFRCRLKSVKVRG